MSLEVNAPNIIVLSCVLWAIYLLYRIGWHPNDVPEAIYDALRKLFKRHQGPR